MKATCIRKFVLVAPLIAVALLPCVGAAQSMAPAQAEEHHEHKVKVVSTSLALTAAGKTTTFKLADLTAMPQRTLVVHNGHSNVDETYTGVGLDDLLAKAGYTLDNGGQKRILHSYVRAEGTDRYFALYSAAELEPALHTTDAIVALTLDGKPLTEDGQFKLIVQGEKKPARWVTNLSSLSVITLE